jgi:hypothetical protein
MCVSRTRLLEMRLPPATGTGDTPWSVQTGKCPGSVVMTESTCLVSRCANEAPKLVGPNQAAATRIYSSAITSEYPATIRTYKGEEEHAEVRISTD